MKVKDLIRALQIADQESYVHVQTDKRFEEDILRIKQYETESATIILLSSVPKSSTV
ncbi:hypothetical protein AB4X15_02885 [Peribacillus simplex]|uniref:hypothetical protein n=1 Tax=Peribacillus simplex TaxID=1478 RepID=UPI0034E8F93F